MNSSTSRTKAEQPVGKSSPPTSARVAQAATTEAAILTSARRAFAEKGYDGAGLRGIAEDAGVTAMMIGHYYGSKENLFEEVVATTMEQPIILAASNIASSTRVRDMARALVGLTAPGTTPLERFLILFRSASSLMAAEIGRRKITEMNLRSTQEMIGDEVHASQRAALFLSVVAGIQIMRQMIGLKAQTHADAEALAAAGPAKRLVPPAWVEAPSITLWPNGTPGGGYKPRPLPMNDAPPVFIHNVAAPYLRVFRPERSNGRALLVIPGGAYVFVSIDNEGVDVAREFVRYGYTVFVLVYRLPGEGWANRSDVPLQDAQRAMRAIRSVAESYSLDRDQIVVLGFSAGGHLAATLATDFDQQVYAPADAADRLSARPLAVGLVYPVISMAWPFTHEESSKRLLGADPDDAAIARRSPADHIGPSTPPIFLTHALDDPAVPPANSMLMMEAMRNARRPVAMHLFESGGHGFGLAPADLPAHAWPDLFSDFLDRHVKLASEQATS